MIWIPVMAAGAAGFLLGRLFKDDAYEKQVAHLSEQVRWWRDIANKRLTKDSPLCPPIPQEEFRK